MKQAVKRCTQAALSVIPRLARHLPYKSLLIVTYHRVLPNNHPDLCIMQPGMVVHRETFRKHLAWLKELFEIVDLTAWLRNGCAHSRAACAITFDDGWQDTFEFAYPVLQEQQVPATLFIVSDLVGTNESFWPEKLARLLWNDGHGLPRDALEEIRSILGPEVNSDLLQAGIPSRHTIDNVIENAKRCSDHILAPKIAAAEERLVRRRRNTFRDILTWEQVRTMSQSGLVAVGSHSRHHMRFSSTLDKRTLEGEILGSKELIQAKLGTDVKIFCYPGGVVSRSAEELVRHHYKAACTTRRGWNSPRTDSFRLKRISVHEDVGSDVTSFLARVSGLL